jgi:hypothetical protein
MFRIGTALLLALSLGSSAAQAAVPASAANAMLEQNVGFQLDTYRGLLTAMTRDKEEWRTDEDFDAHARAARQALGQARSSHASGDDEAALRSLNGAWREIGPIVKVWSARATESQKRAFVRAMLGDTSDRIALLQRYSADLPADAAEALDRAESAHAEAQSLRNSDARAAIGKEREAMRALDRSFAAMWADYEGGDS